VGRGFCVVLTCGCNRGGTQTSSLRGAPTFEVMAARGYVPCKASLTMYFQSSISMGVWVSSSGGSGGGVYLREEAERRLYPSWWMELPF
jgi:hypothetical protein